MKALTSVTKRLRELVMRMRAGLRVVVLNDVIVNVVDVNVVAVCVEVGPVWVVNVPVKLVVVPVVVVVLVNVIVNSSRVGWEMTIVSMVAPTLASTHFWLMASRIAFCAARISAAVNCTSLGSKTISKFTTTVPLVPLAWPVFPVMVTSSGSMPLYAWAMPDCKIEVI